MCQCSLVNVYVYQNRNEVEVVKVKHANIFTKQRYQKVDKNHMMDIVTGEVIEIDPNKDLERKVRNKLNTVRRLILANFDGSNNELFATLTYREPTHDFRKVKKDLQLFIRRLKYRYQDSRLKYIGIIEPNSNGELHVHLLLKVPHEIDTDLFTKLWGHGFIGIEHVFNTIGVSLYLSKCKRKADNLKYYTTIDFVVTSKNLSRPKKLSIHRYGYTFNKDLVVFFDKSRQVYHRQYNITKDVSPEIAERFGKKQAVVNEIEHEVYRFNSQEELLLNLSLGLPEAYAEYLVPTNPIVGFGALRIGSTYYSNYRCLKVKKSFIYRILQKKYNININRPIKRGVLQALVLIDTTTPRQPSM